MTASKKTDNHDPRAKLNLRRYFLEKYHPQGTACVLDCCMGSGFIWNEIRKSWRVNAYVGLDVKPKKGRLKIDSSRYLSAGGWTHDLIDIDTYGSPWRHWLAVCDKGQVGCTVFLTIGHVHIGGGGGMQSEAKAILGLPAQTPPGIIGQLNVHAERACLAACLVRWRVVESLEAESRGNARYLGIRLEIK